MLLLPFMLAALLSLKLVTCHPHGYRVGLPFIPSMSQHEKFARAETPTSSGVVNAQVLSLPQKHIRTYFTTSTTRYPKHYRASTAAGCTLIQSSGLPVVSSSSVEFASTQTSGIIHTSTQPETTPPITTLIVTPITSKNSITAPTATTTDLRTWYSGTPTEFLATQTWTTPSAPPCTAGPQPSVTTTVMWDDIPVTWWYGLVPTQYAGLHLRNTFVLDSRIIDLDWSEVPVSKPNFAVHPGYRSNNPDDMGDFENSGFISLPDGSSFDIISFWVQCDRPCELHVYELSAGWAQEKELFTNSTIEPNSVDGRIRLPGGLAQRGMKYLELEKTFGQGAGTKLRWLRYWAKDTRENPREWLSPAQELAVGIDDLVLRRRMTGSEPCVEFKL